MKSRLITATLACLLTVAFALPATAHEYDQNDSDNPMRLVGYVVHPFGYVADHLVMRPIHWVVSQKGFCDVFGHDYDPRATIWAKPAPVETEPTSDAPIKDVEVAAKPNAVEFTMLGDVLFASGSAALTDQGKGVLTEVVKTVKEKYAGSPIMVEGHTDNKPIQASGWKSNWELGFARSAAIVHFFEKQGFDTKTLAACSFGDTKPVVANDTAENMAKNRRAVLVVKTGGMPCCGAAPSAAAGSSAPGCPMISPTADTLTVPAA
ncbi:TPA: hypothetical protein DDW35_14030, partial [Candidatus Sumerlaeota bacterium]|nr:hypothetical protein [Candidatus Sumerlaeota bacterium]